METLAVRRGCDLDLLSVLIVTVEQHKLFPPTTALLRSLTFSWLMRALVGAEVAFTVTAFDTEFVLACDD